MLNSSIQFPIAAQNDEPDEKLLRLLQIKSDIKACKINISGISIVHVAGSKGKGSTCSFIESILRSEGFKTGCLTSPHLVDVEERIRINGRPINQKLFIETFWNVHESLIKYRENNNEIPPPTFLTYITALAFKVFAEERVDVAIVEVGIGGRFDTTNFIESPAVSVVSGIHLEHQELLGDSIESIAWNKAGIFKPNVPAVVTSNLQPDVMCVFVKEAEKVKCPLYVAPSLKDLFTDSLNSKDLLSLASLVSGNPTFELNSCLALAAVQLWNDSRKFKKHVISYTGHPQTLKLLPSKAQINGLLSSRWPGRFEIIRLSEQVVIFIDCAHTLESIHFCSKWYSEEISRNRPSTECLQVYRVLVFTVLGTRDPLPMLKTLKVLNFDRVLFVDLKERVFTRNPSKQTQAERCLEAWNSLSEDVTKTTQAFKIIDTADLIGCLKMNRLPVVAGVTVDKNVGFQVLVTGSVHLVGEIFYNLRPEHEIQWTCQ